MRAGGAKERLCITCITLYIRGVSVFGVFMSVCICIFVLVLVCFKVGELNFSLLFILHHTLLFLVGRKSSAQERYNLEELIIELFMGMRIIFSIHYIKIEYIYYTFPRSPPLLSTPIFTTSQNPSSTQ